MSDQTFNPPEMASKPPIKGRVTPTTRAALEFMAQTGADRPTAAKEVGMHPESLARALRRPHVKAVLNQMIADVRENAAQRAYLRVNNLAATTENERMRFDASRWVAGIDGISPVQKVQGSHHHNHQFGGFEYVRPPDVIEATTDTPSAATDTQGYDNND